MCRFRCFSLQGWDETSIGGVEILSTEDTKPNGRESASTITARSPLSLRVLPFIVGRGSRMEVTLRDDERIEDSFHNEYKH